MPVSAGLCSCEVRGSQGMLPNTSRAMEGFPHPQLFTHVHMHTCYHGKHTQAHKHTLHGHTTPHTRMAHRLGLLGLRPVSQSNRYYQSYGLTAIMRWTPHKEVRRDVSSNSCAIQKAASWSYQFFSSPSLDYFLCVTHSVSLDKPPWTQPPNSVCPFRLLLPFALISSY